MDTHRDTEVAELAQKSWKPHETNYRFLRTRHVRLSSFRVRQRLLSQRSLSRRLRRFRSRQTMLPTRSPFGPRPSQRPSRASWQFLNFRHLRLRLNQLESSRLSRFPHLRPCLSLAADDVGTAVISIIAIARTIKSFWIFRIAVIAPPKFELPYLLMKTST